MADKTGYTRKTLTVTSLLEGAARRIVQTHGPADLRGCVILVSNPHAIPDVAAALQKASAAPALLLPRITTLPLWAAEVPLAQAVASRSARELALYQALSERAWLKHADLWSLAGELTALFDELTRHHVRLAHGVDDFARKLEEAYRARPGASLRFEAQLVHELWWATSQGDAKEVAPEAAYQARLIHLATRARLPLYALDLRGFSRVERDFVDRYRGAAPVIEFAIEEDAGDSELARTLTAAWPVGTSVALGERARALRGEARVSALRRRVRLFGAASPEQEAQAIDVTVRDWLLHGRRSIAVVVLDRVVARRARALLERGQVLVSDESGWAFSTTSAATVVGRWLDVVADNCYYQDLLDLMKSPFAFHDVGRDQRRQAVWRLERYARDTNTVSGLSNFIRLAQRHADRELEQILMRVERGAALLSRNRKPVAAWIRALQHSLSELGIESGLQDDAAGSQLLDLLNERAREIKDNGMLLRFPDWRRWLARELETATFRDATIASPVVFTYLAATRLRRFDAVLVCGCDAQHLPGPEALATFFNQGVRKELGLPTRAEEVSEIERDLKLLIASSGEVLFTWQSRVAGEDNLVSPILERLNALHLIAYGAGLDDESLAPELEGRLVQRRTAPLPPQTTQPRAVAVSLIPAEISASGYNALVACPYQFYARHMLRLRELDDMQELMDKRDYGNLLHGLLADFHRRYPIVREVEPDRAQEELVAISEAAFSDAVKSNYLAAAWLLSWKSLIPLYLDWQRDREAQGWRWHAAEIDRKVEITTPEGRKLVLRGRLDRVDKLGSDAAVIDYKTSSAKTLKEKLAVGGEDVQLPVYALLWGGPVARAVFLALDREGVQDVELRELAQLAQQNKERLGRIYDALSGGARLPAHGAAGVCEYCELEGLCRRRHWS